jgi:hypothetical protein
MTNLLAEAINSDGPDRAAKLIQDALGIESDDVVNYEDLAGRPRAARPHHWDMADDRGALSSLVTEPAAFSALVGR